MLSLAYDEVPSFNEVTAKYDEAFFSESTLLLVYAVAHTGSYRFAVDAISGDGTSLCVQIAETTHAEGVTDDMTGWFITVAVPDSAAAAYTDFDAVLACKVGRGVLHLWAAERRQPQGPMQASLPASALKNQIAEGKTPSAIWQED